jgi:hypothetical protein
MAAWTIGIEISGSRIDGEGLARLVAVFEQEFPDFETDCALWSGWLGVHTTVTSPTPAEALDAALRAIDLAFDQADIDRSRASEVMNVTMRRARRLTLVPHADSLPQALLRRVLPARRF